ncbi:MULTISPECIES: hypothetical protein [Bacillus cereus group]|uniref:NADH dehydrogenase n=1 Tax=Bacillus thuringiensis subsp. jegathesan TaxID=56955 RepID=A0A9X6M2G2_BACTJ|nr:MULTISPECIES: hypothetical protein [Bacillus cereus group]MDA4083533.1 hypothetical protein [Bacillus cereus]MDW8785447.1 hypothetical protein [Bacillus cereus]MDZ4468016.1 hypothetical protein [Bacillus cereus]MDZ4527755.1 hypothetical protein [Bacillus cereus]MDZ4562174.1 hypothetical protein [Bacillus cereus]
MNNKLLLALTSCVLIIGLAACSSNENASTANDSKAEEKIQKEAEKAKMAEEKAKQEEQQRQEAEVKKEEEEKAKQEAEAQRQAEEKAKQEQTEREEQQRQEQEQARKQQAAQEQKQREVKQQKKEEPELCGSPEVGITCEHVQKEWENEQKIEKELKEKEERQEREGLEYAKRKAQSFEDKEREKMSCDDAKNVLEQLKNAEQNPDIKESIVKYQEKVNMCSK